MKCIILGFDGLEYNFVEKFQLDHLKQKEYGKTTIPKECFVKVNYFGKERMEPFTPLIWSSFLTGKLPEQHGVTRSTFIKWENPIVQTLKVVSSKIGLGRIRGKRKFLEKIGFKRRGWQKSDYSVPTIFDLAEKSIQINVPTIDEKWTVQLFPEVSKEENFDVVMQKSLDYQWKMFLKIKNQALKKIKEEWNLFMLWTKLLDTYGELLVENKSELLNVYRACDSFVREIKKKVDDAFFLIVSDHGIEKLEDTKFGKHSTHGFYSSNISLGLNNPFITDFYELITMYLLKKEDNKHGN